MALILPVCLLPDHGIGKVLYRSSRPHKRGGRDSRNHRVGIFHPLSRVCALTSVLLVIIISVFRQTVCVMSCEFRSVSEVVEGLFNETRYNSRSRPGADTGEWIDCTGEVIARYCRRNVYLRVRRRQVSRSIRVAN